MKKLLIIGGIILTYQFMTHDKGTTSTMLALGESTPSSVIEGQEKEEKKKKQLTHFMPFDTLIEGTAKSYVQVVKKPAPFTIGTERYGVFDIGITVRLRSLKPMPKQKRNQGLFEPPPDPLVMVLDLLTETGDPVGIAGTFNVIGTNRDKYDALINGKMKEADIRFVYRQKKGDLTKEELLETFLASDARTYKVSSYR